MTHNEHQCLRQLQERWRKEQQLIRKKYKISYSISKQFQFQLPTSTLKKEKIKEKCRQEKHDLKIPPIYCRRCNLNPSNCLCKNGLGEWWTNLMKKTLSTENLSDQSSTNSVVKQHSHFNFNLFEVPSRKRTQTKKTATIKKEPIYVLLDWNNSQSLISFIQERRIKNNVLNMTLEQLRHIITINDHIHVSDSMIDLQLAINKAECQILPSQIYIDPSYYLAIENATPLFQTRLIADNLNLKQVQHSIQRITSLLANKADQTIDNILRRKLL